MKVTIIQRSWVMAGQLDKRLDERLDLNSLTIPHLRWSSSHWTYRANNAPKNVELKSKTKLIYQLKHWCSCTYGGRRKNFELYRWAFSFITIQTDDLVACLAFNWLKRSLIFNYDFHVKWFFQMNVIVSVLI